MAWAVRMLVRVRNSDHDWYDVNFNDHTGEAEVIVHSTVVWNPALSLHFPDRCGMSMYRVVELARKQRREDP